MSLSVNMFAILFFIDLGFFLLANAYPAQFSAVSPPIFSIFGGGGNVSWDQILTPAIIAEVGVIIAAVLGYSYLLNIQGIITGQPFTITLLPLIIALAFFIAFAVIPNISGLGIPSPLNIVIQSIFGLLFGISVYGIFRGE